MYVSYYIENGVKLCYNDQLSQWSLRNAAYCVDITPFIKLIFIYYWNEMMVF